MNLRRLVLANIKGNLFRSGAILLCAALVVSLGMATTMIVQGAEGSLRRNLSRLGADIIVVPWGTMAQDQDGAHLMGMLTHRWMPWSYMERITAIQGVEAVSPQLYLAQVVDSPFCVCDEMHVLAYDPTTDFALKPWLEDDPLGILRLSEAVVGSAVSAPDGGDAMHVFGYPLRLVRRLPETGGDIDHAVFVSFDTARAIEDHVRADLRPAFELQPDSISTAMVKVRLGSSPHEVAVRILEQVPGTLALESAGFFQTQRAQIVGLMRTTLVLAILTWSLAVVFMGMVFSLAANERRREIAVLRALGATGASVVRVLLWEGAFLAVSGGLFGAALMVALVGLLSDQFARLLGVWISLPEVLPLLALVAAGIALALGSVLLAAWIPTQRLSRQEPALTMRE